MHFSSLIGSIKIDFATFLEFHEKYKLRKLLEKLEAEEPDEETKLKIYKAMDIDGDGLISEFEFKQWAKKTLQVKNVVTKGQLVSKCLFDVFNSSKKPEKKQFDLR